MVEGCVPLLNFIQRTNPDKMSFQVFLVLDIPTPSHIPSLITSFVDSAFFSQFRTQPTKGDGESEYAMRTIFHLCGDAVLNDFRYRIFMSGFPSDTHVSTLHYCHMTESVSFQQHIVASREHNTDPVTFTSAAFNTLRLNQLDSDIFPLPTFNLKPMKDIAGGFMSHHFYLHPT